MNLAIIILSVVAAFLLVAIVILLLRVKNLKNHLLYINSRIDSVRLNYLLGLRNNLIATERYEDVDYINSLIKDEFGIEDFEKFSIEYLINIL
jgi:hypothetical protein|nr:MAG TPA: hypothetical protein [Caudoviricetes sp.]